MVDTMDKSFDARFMKLVSSLLFWSFWRMQMGGNRIPIDPSYDAGLVKRP
jgi:hypothetical protein